MQISRSRSYAKAQVLCVTFNSISSLSDPPLSKGQVSELRKRNKAGEKSVSFWAKGQHIVCVQLEKTTSADDLESARQLMAEKSEVSRLEGKSRKKHLKRLASGEGDSFDSSDIHLDALRALKDLNSQYAAVAYPILYKGGQLLETRLITTLDEDEP